MMDCLRESLRCTCGTLRRMTPLDTSPVAGQSGGLQFVAFLAFGTAMTLAGILAAALPETLGVATAETLAQPLLRGAPDDTRMVGQPCCCC